MSASTRGRAARAKGNRSEVAAARYMTGHGWPTKTTRNNTGGVQSLRGDLLIEAAPHVVIDVKDRAQLAVPAWLDQLDDEAGDEPCKALWIKPERVASPGEWVVVAHNWPIDGWRDTFGTIGADWCRHIDTPAMRSLLGWLAVERQGVAPFPVIGWNDRDTEWLLMDGETFVETLLVLWEGAHR